MTGYEEAFDDVVAHVTVSALAAALGEKIATVSNWRKRGVPPNRCKAVEKMTGVSVERLRPSDWKEYWPAATSPRQKAQA